MGRIAIHCEPGIEWQKRRAPQFVKGLKALGIHGFLTNSRVRVTDHAILLGTTCWRGVEASGDYLLVDRASFGDPDFVTLGWNGHGRRAQFDMPTGYGGRWKRYKRLVHLYSWDYCGDRTVLCGQTETYSPHYETLEDWYATVEATHFRPHPQGHNPTALPYTRDWTDCGQAVTLNSSIGVESVIKGIPTVTMDEGAMAWQVSSHEPGEFYTPNRSKWLEWLCWTQWSWSEIDQGLPIRHLFASI